MHFKDGANGGLSGRSTEVRIYARVIALSACSKTFKFLEHALFQPFQNLQFLEHFETLPRLAYFVALIRQEFSPKNGLHLLVFQWLI